MCAERPLDNNSIDQVSLLKAQVSLRELPKWQRRGQDERRACCLGFLYKALDIADSAKIPKAQYHKGEEQSPKNPCIKIIKFARDIMNHLKVRLMLHKRFNFYDARTIWCRNPTPFD